MNSSENEQVQLEALVANMKRQLKSSSKNELIRNIVALTIQSAIMEANLKSAQEKLAELQKSGEEK